MERARRRLTLDIEHERAILELCTQADAACYYLHHGGTDAECKRVRAALAAAWRKVNHEVMP